MKDLKNILNYFGEYWRLDRCGNAYSLTWEQKDGSCQSIHANGAKKMSAKIHKIINECAITKPKQLISSKSKVLTTKVDITWEPTGKATKPVRKNKEKVKRNKCTK